jgi:uncharacterized OsmC-like protein
MTDLTVERTGKHEFTARNDRGASVRIGRPGMPGVFTPGELLQVATAGCSAITVEEFVTRRAGDDAPITATVEGTRGPHEYTRVSVTLRADLSFLDDETRARVERAMHNSVLRECTVSRTLERGAPVDLTLETRP